MALRFLITIHTKIWAEINFIGYHYSWRAAPQRQSAMLKPLATTVPHRTRDLRLPQHIPVYWEPYEPSTQPILRWFRAVPTHSVPGPADMHLLVNMSVYWTGCHLQFFWTVLYSLSLSLFTFTLPKPGWSRFVCPFYTNTSEQAIYDLGELHALGLYICIDVWAVSLADDC